MKDPVNKVRKLLILFIVALIVSGLTAFPIEWELRLGLEVVKALHWQNDFAGWIALAHKGVKETNDKYPFMAYGTDWLAFAHIIIAIAFIGPIRNPVRNIWVIEFGIIACVLVFPLAFIAGAVRSIPVYWRFIDCSFGFLGLVPLIVCHGKIRQLEKKRMLIETGVIKDGH
jgi:hypothetical protein